MPKYTINVNKSQREVTVSSDTPLLYVLRNHLELNGPKYGCGLAQCGSCMVLIDGVSSESCMITIGAIGTREITTLEGIADKDGNLHPVQKAIAKEQAAQCGYCINGMIMSSVSLLNRNPSPTEEEIKNALQTNLCRCSAHTRIIKAVKTAQTL